MVKIALRKTGKMEIATVSHFIGWVAFGLLRPLWGLFALTPLLITTGWILFEIHKSKRRDETN